MLCLSTVAEEAEGTTNKQKKQGPGILKTDLATISCARFGQFKPISGCMQMVAN